MRNAVVRAERVGGSSGVRNYNKMLLTGWCDREWRCWRRFDSECIYLQEPQITMVSGDLKTGKLLGQYSSAPIATMGEELRKTNCNDLTPKAMLKKKKKKNLWKKKLCHPTFPPQTAANRHNPPPRWINPDTNNRCLSCSHPLNNGDMQLKPRVANDVSIRHIEQVIAIKAPKQLIVKPTYRD